MLTVAGARSIIRAAAEKPAQSTTLRNTAKSSMLRIAICSRSSQMFHQSTPFWISSGFPEWRLSHHLRALPAMKPALESLHACRHLHFYPLRVCYRIYRVHQHWSCRFAGQQPGGWHGADRAGSDAICGGCGDRCAGPDGHGCRLAS
ncbi:hypothetical protein D3C85_1490030 [compost metagenome]